MDKYIYKFIEAIRKLFTAPDTLTELEAYYIFVGGFILFCLPYLNYIM